MAGFFGSAFGGASLGSAIGQILINTGASEANIDRLEGRLTGFAANTAKIGANSAVLGAGLTAIGAGIGAGFITAGNAAATFEQQMSAVKAVAGATASQFDALRDKALQLGKDTQYSATEAAQAIEELSKAGVSVTNILGGAADAAVSLAAAGGIALPQSATIIANTMNQFSLSGQDVVRVADLFAAAASGTDADVQGLGDALTYVGATAHSVGMSLDETVAILGALSDQGLDASSAGTALNQMILSLVNPTDTATSALAALGISVFDNNGKFIGATEFVKRFAAATADMTDQQRLAYEGQIFTTHGLNALNLLLNDTTESQIKAGKGLDDYQKLVTKSGAAADQAKTRMDNFRGSMEQLRGSVETLDIRIGDVFLPTARRVVDAATRMVNVAIKLPDPLLKAGVALAGVAGAAASLAGAFILAAPKVSAAIRVFNEIKPALLATLGPIEAVIAAAALLGFAYESNFLGVRDGVNALARAIAEPIGRITSIIGFATHSLDELLNFRHGNASGVLSQILTISAGFQRFGVGSTEAVQLALSLDKLRLPIVRLQNDFHAMTPVVEGFFRTIGGDRSKAQMKAFTTQAQYLFGRAVGRDFVDSTKRLGDALGTMFDELKAGTGIDLTKYLSLPGAFSLAADVFGDVARVIDRQLLPAIGRDLVTAIDLTTAGVGFLTGHMSTLIAGFDGAKRAAGDLVGIIGGTLQGVFTVIDDLAKGDYSGAWADFKATIRNTFSGAIDLGEITLSLAGWIIDTSEDVLGAVEDWIGGRLGLGGAAAGGTTNRSGRRAGGGGSREITGRVSVGAITLAIGGWIVQEGGAIGGTLADKVIGFIADAWSALKSTATTLTGKTIDLAGWIITSTERLADDVIGFIAGLWPGVRDTATLLTGKAIALGGWAISGAERLGDKVVGWIAGAWPGIRDAATELTGKVVHLGGWAIGQGENLADAIIGKIASWWPGVRDTATTLAGKLVDVAGYVWDEASQGKLKTDLSTAIQTLLETIGITVSDWKVSFNSPNGDNITVDVAGIASAIWDKLNVPLEAPPGTSTKAHDIGQRLGEQFVTWIGDGLKAFFSIGGTSGAGAAAGGSEARQGEGWDQVASSFLLGIAEALAQGVIDAAAKIPGQVWNDNAKGAQAFADEFVTGFMAVWTWDPGQINEKITGKLNDLWTALSTPISSWFDGLGDKIAGIFSGGGTTPAAATGAGIPLPGAGGVDVGSIITKALTFDFSDIPTPKLPDWLTNPSSWLGPLGSLADKLNTVGHKLENAYNFVSGILGKIGGLAGGNDDTSASKTVPNLNGGKVPQLGDPNAGGLLGPNSTFWTNLGLDNVTGDRTGVQGDSPPLTIHIPVKYQVGAPENSPQANRNGPGSGIASVLASLGLGAISQAPGGYSGTTPPVTITVPVTYKVQAGAAPSANDLARNGPEGGAAAPETITVTAKFLADDSDVATKYTDVSDWAAAWAAQAPRATFGADDGPAAIAYTDVSRWGAAWGGSTFTAALAADNGPAARAYTDASGWGATWDAAGFAATFGIDNGPAARAYTDAFTWGDAWDRAVFTASFSVDTSGLIAASNTADAVAAHIAAVMPHSPAKEGPLRRPITFDYIGDNFAKTATRLRLLARQGAASVAALAAGQDVGVAYANRASANAGGAAPSVVVTNHNYALKPEDLVNLMNNAQSGADAAAFIVDRYGG